MVEGVNELSEKIHDVFGKLLHILSEHEARLNKLEERLLIPAGQVDAENTRLKKEWEESDFIGLSLEQKETLVYLLRKQSSFYTEQIAVGVGLPKEKVSRAVNGLIQKQSPHPNKKVIYEEILERIHDRQYRFTPEMRSKYGEIIEAVWVRYGDNSL